MVQFGAGVGERLEIEMRRQNLYCDLSDCVIVADGQECVDRQLHIVGWISDAVAAVFLIEHRCSVTCLEDLIGLTSQERPYASSEPEPLFFDRAERLLRIAKPTLDELFTFTLDCLPVSTFLFRKNLRSFDARQMFPDA